jgi:hypothetical protein
MTEGKRPGGLTALAVFNFIGSGLDILGILTILGTAFFSGVLIETMDEAQAQKSKNASAQEQPGQEEAAPEEAPQRNRKKTDEERKQEQAREVLKAWGELGYGVLAVWVAAMAALTILLLVSGIGYLKQKRFLGRKLGNAYAILSIVTTVLELAILPDVITGGKTIMVVVAFLYPVLTLILLNTTFREDFVY